MSFGQWLIDPENINSNIFTLITVVISGIISWGISALYFHCGNRNNVTASLLHPMKRILEEPFSWNNYKSLEEIYRGYSAKYLKKGERKAIDNLLSAYKEVCPYDHDRICAEALFSYFIYKLKTNGINPKPVPIYFEDEQIDQDFPDGIYSMTRSLQEIISGYNPECDDETDYKTRIICTYNLFKRECYSDQAITYFDDYSLEEVLQNSKIRIDWDNKFKLAKKAKREFLSLKALK